MDSAIRSFFHVLFNALQQGSTTALAALGIVLIFRTSRTTNFAQSSIATLNAFVAAWLFSSHGFSIWVATPLALVTAFITGVFIDRAFIRRAPKNNPIARPIITLGIIMIIIGILPMVFRIGQSRPDGSPITYRLPRFFSGGIDVFGASLRYNQIFTVVVSIALMVGVFLFINHTKWGLATRVTASDETTARLMGVPTGKVTMFSWAFAAMFGTFAGIVLAPLMNMSPTFLVETQVNAFFASVVGGFTTFFGPVIAAYIIVFLDSYFPVLFNFWDGADIWGTSIVFIMVLIFLYFRPYGLFGEKPIKKV